MRTTATECDVLIVSELPLWPLDQGSKVHGCGMARGLAELGVRVRMASVRSTPIGDAPAWLTDMLVQWPAASHEDTQRFTGGWAGKGAWLRHRVASHQGVEPPAVAGVLALVRGLRPAAVVALGQHGPMILRGLHEACPDLATVWYAADDPVLFQLSCLRREGLAGLSRARMLAVYALLERSFGDRIGGVIGVNPADTAALARLSGIPHAATIPNGVDTTYYAPLMASPASEDPATASAKPTIPAEFKPFHRPGLDDLASTPVAETLQWPDPRPRSLVFWGRMDFEPNADAVCWFARRVWPALRERHPDATWAIVGKNPSAAVQRLHGLPGVTVTGEAEDIRPYAHAATAVVLPMRCGGGIKNKALEAAAMGRPIVASPRALQGLALPPGGEPPMLVCRRERDWVAAMDRLWVDPDYAGALGRRARAWVAQHHTWRGAAEQLLDLIGAITHERAGAKTNRDALVERAA